MTAAIRRFGAGVLTALGALLVWFDLTAPDRLSGLRLGALLQIPLEALAVAALVLVLPTPARRLTAFLFGLLLGPLTVVKFLDMGCYEVLGRRFDAVTDWRYLGSAVSFVADSGGRSRAVILLVTGGLLVLAVLIFTPLAVLRLTRILSEHRNGSWRAITVVGLVWLLGAALGVQLSSGVPLASTTTAAFAYREASRIPAEIRDEQRFAEVVSRDQLHDDIPEGHLLTGLRGKDVLLVFVESYGRVAVERSAMSPGVDAVLTAGNRRLRAAGFATRSAYLRSPTFGGLSWLAHSTLQSGVWVDSQQRYDLLVASRRLTLSDAFDRAGWRTVGDVPANREDWPEATSFYHYDQVYDSRNVGYTGPKFGYSTMPDQYSLWAFHRLELARRHRAPVMAEIDLTSSHAPWAPIPRMANWARIHGGTIFKAIHARAERADAVWQSTDRVKAAYGHSIEYSLNALTSFVQTYGRRDLVLIVLGDHQPATIVSGDDATHDVPITVIAHDPEVLSRIAGWGWDHGMQPGSDAPVWRMDAFRDRFLTAFSS